MAKIIKFNKKNDNNKESKTKENGSENSKTLAFKNEKEKSVNIENIEDSLKEAISNYIKSVFAVKEILEIEIVYKENKFTIGVLGGLVYEHKRRGGPFIADFIAECIKEKNNIRVIEVAFAEGEPDLYMSILKTLKAKKALPEIEV